MRMKSAMTIAIVAFWTLYVVSCPPRTTLYFWMNTIVAFRQ
jgi:hypothetical protein